MVEDQDGRPDPADQPRADPALDWIEPEAWGARGHFARCWAALMYDSMEEYLSLIDALTAHLASDPECLPAYNNRAVAFDEIGEVDKAERDFRDAAARVSDDSLPLKNFAMFLERRRGDVETAIALYERALGISPFEQSLHRCMARALVKRERHLEALAFFTQAIKLDPTFARTYRDRADAFQKLGRRVPATADRLVANILDRWHRLRRRSGR